MENLQRREQSLAEIDSDLTRIEAEVALAVENATLRGQPQAVSSNIDLVSQSLDPGIYGSSEADVADLDQSFAAPATVKQS